MYVLVSVACMICDTICMLYTIFIKNIISAEFDLRGLVVIFGNL